MRTVECRYLAHTAEAVEVVGSTLPTKRQNALPFKNNRPGINWIRAFYRRHKTALQFAIPNPQKAKRFAATNGKTLASHFAIIDALVKEYALDDERIWNLDETSCSPGRVSQGNGRQARFLWLRARNDSQIPEFLSTFRVTMCSEPPFREPNKIFLERFRHQF